MKSTDYADYTDFVQGPGAAGEPKGGRLWVRFSFAWSLNQTQKQI